MSRVIEQTTFSLEFCQRQNIFVLHTVNSRMTIKIAEKRSPEKAKRYRRLQHLCLLTSFRTIFNAVHLNEKTLTQLYSLGLSLKHLNISKCYIRNLPPNLFYFLPNLVHAGGNIRMFQLLFIKLLDFSQNLLCSLPVSLAHHCFLEIILLKKNFFTSFPAILETLPRLRYHDLHDLQILEQCDSDVEEDNIQTVSISLRD